MSFSVAVKSLEGLLWLPAATQGQKGGHPVHLPTQDPPSATSTAPGLLKESLKEAALPLLAFLLSGKFFSYWAKIDLLFIPFLFYPIKDETHSHIYRSALNSYENSFFFSLIRTFLQLNNPLPLLFLLAIRPRAILFTLAWILFSIYTSDFIVASEQKPSDNIFKK